MRISIIVAMDENGGIGFENRLPWRLSADLKRFHRLTMGHHLILGRRTYESIGRALPGRRMIVITKNAATQSDEVDVVSSLDEAIHLAEGRGEREAFIGGGSEVFRLALPLADRIYLTRVHARAQADVFFPEFDIREWIEISSEQFDADEQNQYPTTYMILEKSPLKKLQNEAAGRHIWGCVRSTHPHICRPESSTLSFCNGLREGIRRWGARLERFLTLNSACDNISRVQVPWCSGQTCRPVKAESAGSTPVGTANRQTHPVACVRCGFSVNEHSLCQVDARLF